MSTEIDKSVEQNTMLKSEELQVVVLDGGSYRERGLVHGETLRDLIQEHHERWVLELATDTGLSEDTYLSQLFSDTDFLPAIERWTPNLLEEVKGISEGANVEFRYALARQLSDEEPWYRREKKLAISEGRGCSSIGLSCVRDRPTTIGQNMDTPAWYGGHQILFHHKGPDLPVEVFSFALAGKINLCGMNSHGLSICCNTLAQLNYSKDGLPEDFVVRGFLAQPDLEKGLDFLQRVKHASGQNYTIAEPGSRAINLEVSAGKISEFVPFDGADRVYHTNHPLVNDDQSIFQHIIKCADEPQALLPSFVGSSIPRFEEFQARMSDPQEMLTLDDMKKILSSHQAPVCRHSNDSPNKVITLGCLIMELTTPPALHIAPGPPCKTPFKTYRF